MIDRMAGKIAQWNKGILKLSEEESKVVEYGISVFLDSVFKFLVLLFISILIGKEIEFGLSVFFLRITLLGRRNSLFNEGKMPDCYDCFMFYHSLDKLNSRN